MCLLPACRYQQILHRNLVYLATIADSNQNMQSLLPAVSARGGGGGSAVGRCLGARAREWRSGVAEACRARRAGLPVTQEISQTCPKCAGQSRAVSLFGRGVTPEEPGLEMAGGGPQEGQAVAQILALLRELF